MKEKSFSVAILQGRLSPDIDKRYQFFPKERWQDEFKVAQELGFDGIEWLIDPKDWEENPIFHVMPDEVQAVAQASSLPVMSICADWFMEVCIWEGDPETHRAHIRSLFPQLQKTVNKVLLVPLLETHNISASEVQEKVVAVLKPLSAELEAQGIGIAFETELSAPELTSFLEKFESDVFGVYYDVGNCTSYGFDCPNDILVLGKRIKGIHLKDRKVGTTKPLLLGTGDADFAGVLQALTEIDWQGALVMQAWRGEHYIEDARAQLQFVRSFFN
jgi:hexulose-6-phosphate isomerase